MKDTYYLIDGNRVFIFDNPNPTEGPDTNGLVLPIVDTFSLTKDYDNGKGVRHGNTIYIWFKESQDLFKGELRLMGIPGYEDGYGIVGFGDSFLECLEDILSQYTGNDVVWIGS
jgi:hypothetical protein